MNHADAKKNLRADRLKMTVLLFYAYKTTFVSENSGVLYAISTVYRLGRNMSRDGVKMTKYTPYPNQWYNFAGDTQGKTRCEQGRGEHRV